MFIVLQGQTNACLFTGNKVTCNYQIYYSLCHTIMYVGYLNLDAFLLAPTHPSATDPVEPDPVDYFPLPSGNLASPVPSEYFDFTRPFSCFPNDCSV